MPTVFEILQEARSRTQPLDHQRMTQGMVASVERGLYKVVVGQIEYLANTGISTALKTGDRVWVALGRGTPRIVGLLGKDENAG